METEAVLIREAEDNTLKKRGITSFCFAVLCYAAAYLLLCLVPVNQSPIGFFVLALIFYAVTLIVSLLTGGKFGIWTAVFMIFGLITAFYGVTHGTIEPLLTDSGFTADLFPVFLISGMFYSLFVLSLYGNASGTLGGRLLLDLVKGVCSLFVSFPAFFLAVFKPEGSKKNKRTLLFAVIGIVIALILVLIVTSLLSFDSHFKDMLPKFEFDDVFECLVKLFFSVPLSAMVFSLYFSSREKKLPKLSTKETSESVGSKIKVIPTPVIVIPVIAVLVVYVLFFVSQWAYYMSAFTHKLPEGYLASEYAREGFFQLCAVAAINTVLIIVLSCFNKRNGKAGEILEIVMKILLSLASLILIATAVSKMLLYIDLYDLTRMRLNVTIFLFFLAAAFIFVIISSIVKRFKALPAIAVTGALMLAAISLVNTNRIIAEYNMNMYLSGKHENIDIDYLSEGLGCSSVGSLIKLSEEARDEKVREKALDALYEIKIDLGSDSFEWYDNSIPSIIAKDKLKDR